MSLREEVHREIKRSNKALTPGDMKDRVGSHGVSNKSIKKVLEDLEDVVKKETTKRIYFHHESQEISDQELEDN